MRKPIIVVGTDGTTCGSAAVEWAADEARRRRMPLRIVHAFDWDWNESRLDIGNEYIDVARLLADSVVSAARDRARALAPDVEIETDTLIGHASPRLAEASRDADLLVVGSRGRGGFAGLLLGSVSQRMATRAACPVVVVRGQVTPEGPVVVGADDSPGSDRVLETAFAAAAARDAVLTVVRSYLPVIPLWLADVRPSEVETPAQDSDERARLHEQLAPWIEKYPQVKVEVVLTHQSAAAALVAASAGAQLAVIGSHGHGAIGGALLGSAGLPLLHHAECPVLVVRPEA
ncbi:universal stress protein [Actinoplanes sp. NPDC049596]|uniref:universal stress protein n=1 Tax=unclassified Actinoplanes TaxID=2626549 RepID=UPI003420385F